MNKKPLEPSKSISLQEMAVHCKSGDLGFNFIITVGRFLYINQSNANKKEHTPPHAHVYIKDTHYTSRFLLTNKTIPKEVEDLKTVDETDIPLTKIAKDLIKWINSKPIRSYSKEDKTNWEAMKNSWIDIKDVENEMLEE